MWKKSVLLFLISTGFNLLTWSQVGITRVISDYNGYWSSSSSSINSIVPDGFHNLLAFESNGTIYSTGVNDLFLTGRGVPFIPQDFEALPATVSSSGGLIGLASNYGGSGCAATPYGNNASAYLSDGAKGLNLGTAIFNAGGTISYEVTTLEELAVGDGVPDIIVTQMGQYTSSDSDQLSFIDKDGNVVGNLIDVNFTLAPKIADFNWKFYTRGSTPSCGGASSGNRDFRMVAFDFADLGITPANVSDIARFQHQLSSRSDMAFIAYNGSSISLLPIELTYFQAVSTIGRVQLTWETATESSNDFFTLERSLDGQHWEYLAKINGAGNSSSSITYSYTDNSPYNGVSYYRLAQQDFDGKSETFDPVSVEVKPPNLQLYPNPTSQLLNVVGEISDSEILIYSMSGQNVTPSIEAIFSANDKVQLDIERLEKGMYFLLIDNTRYPFVVL